MKIWGSTKKQRLWIFGITASSWVISFLWVYLTKPNYESTFALLTSSVLMMLFTAYLTIDNSRADRVKFTILMNKNLLDDMSKRYQYEINSPRVRLELAGVLTHLLESVSSKKYGYLIKDITTAVEADNQMSIFHIYADGNHIVTYSILKNNETQLTYLI